MPSLLICDLDGTLVDSFPGIAAALLRACTAVGIQPGKLPDRSMVGPPLDDLLRMVAGPTDDATLARLREEFVTAYDGEACRLSAPFPGIEDMLIAVRARGDTLALATNKRLAPTLAILDALGWRGFFPQVEAVDSRAGGPRTKARMLLDLCAEDVPSRRATVYLGDTEADVRAARAAGLPCILAAWGYATDARGAERVARSPLSVIAWLDEADGMISGEIREPAPGKG